jgi:hypothetical protein
MCVLSFFLELKPERSKKIAMLLKKYITQEITLSWLACKELNSENNPV